MFVPIDVLTGQLVTVAPHQLTGSTMVMIVPAVAPSVYFLPSGLVQEMGCPTSEPPPNCLDEQTVYVF
jgi:hypothetical protein